MNAKTTRLFLPALLALCLAADPVLAEGPMPASALTANDAAPQKPIILKTMGSLFFGGTVSRDEKTGQTFHGDHGYAQFYIPDQAKNLPIVMWHGIGQSGRSFESTPDGREGFQALLPREGWAVYLIDQPRRGRAGRTQSPMPEAAIPTTMMESGVWDAFRLGRWDAPERPTLYPGLQVPKDAWTLDQFMRQQVPDTGELPRTLEHDAFMAKTMRALLDQTGPAILLTHSYGGRFGWFTASIAPELVRGIVAFEPGQHMFPESEPPEPMTSPLKDLPEIMAPQLVPLDQFKKLTAMPILLVYGDNIKTEPGKSFNDEVWRFSLTRARAFVAAINRHGGDATLIHLPELGIKGNTHAPFADLNNRDIARLMTWWLAAKGLDRTDMPHQGPKKPTMEMTIPLTDSAQ